MCDHVTPLIRAACSDPCIGSALIVGITQKICGRLREDPQTTIRFNLFCGEAAGPTEWTKIRVEFFRQDWKFLIDNLLDEDNGTWNEDPLRYVGDFFEVSANAVDNEVLVVFW